MTVKLNDILKYKVSQGFRWDLRFVKFPNIDFTPESEELNIRCISAEVPKVSEMSPIDISIRGYKVSVPGNIIRNGSTTLTMLETDDMVINKFLDSWQEAQKSRDGGASKSKDDLQAIVKLVRLDNENKDNWVWEFKAILESYDPGYTPDAESGEPAKPTITLRYDTFTEYGA